MEDGEEEGDQAEHAVNGRESVGTGVADGEGYEERENSGGEEVLGARADLLELKAVRRADARREEADAQGDPGGEEQAQVAGVGEDEGDDGPGDEGAVGRRHVEDPAEDRDVEDERDHRHGGGEVGEVPAAVAPPDPEGGGESTHGAADQDGDLEGRRESSPEVVEREGDAHAQRDRAE